MAVGGGGVYVCEGRDGRRGFGAWMLTNKHNVLEQPVPPYNDVIGPFLPPLRMGLDWELQNGELIFPFFIFRQKGNA